MKKTEEKKFIRISASFPRGYISRTEEMAEYFDLSKSEIMRRALDEFYDAYRRRRYGYQAGTDPAARRSRKEEKQEKTDFFYTGNADDVISHLTAIAPEIFPAPYIDDAGRVRSFELSGEGAQRQMFEIHTTQGSAEHPQGEVKYRRTVYTSMGQLIEELKKLKKL